MRLVEDLGLPRLLRTDCVLRPPKLTKDTGFRLLQKGQLSRAADLFLRAAYIDEARELPAYNLSCTHARLGDARAEAALVLATARGGNVVRELAAKDTDFDGVGTSPGSCERS